MGWRAVGALAARAGRPWYSWALAPMLLDALRRHYERRHGVKQSQSAGLVEKLAFLGNKGRVAASRPVGLGDGRTHRPSAIAKLRRLRLTLPPDSEPGHSAGGPIGRKPGSGQGLRQK